MTDEAVLPIAHHPLRVTAFGITDKGKVRPNNEDQFLIAELTKAMRVWQTSLPEPKLQAGEERAHLFLVADGMGGQQGGERASALAVSRSSSSPSIRSNGSSVQTAPKQTKCSRSSSPRSAKPTSASSRKRRSIQN